MSAVTIKMNAEPNLLWVQRFFGKSRLFERQMNYFLSVVLCCRFSNFGLYFQNT